MTQASVRQDHHHDTKRREPVPHKPPEGPAVPPAGFYGAIDGR